MITRQPGVEDTGRSGLWTQHSRQAHSSIIKLLCIADRTLTGNHESTRKQDQLTRYLNSLEAIQYVHTMQLTTNAVLECSTNMHQTHIKVTQLKTHWYNHNTTVLCWATKHTKRSTANHLQYLIPQHQARPILLAWNWSDLRRSRSCMWWDLHPPSANSSLIIEPNSTQSLNIWICNELSWSEETWKHCPEHSDLQATVTFQTCLYPNWTRTLQRYKRKDSASYV